MKHSQYNGSWLVRNSVLVNFPAVSPENHSIINTTNTISVNYLSNHIFRQSVLIFGGAGE